MKKKLSVFIGILVMVIMIIFAFERKMEKRLYPITGVVVSTCYDLDEVTFKDFNENLWTFCGVEDWMVGDIVSCIMDGHFTETIEDDEIVSIRYSGYIEKEG